MASKEREKSRLRGIVNSIINRPGHTQPALIAKPSREMPVTTDFREINHKENNIDWISDLAQVFGDPTDILRPQEDLDTWEEIAVYSISPNGTKSNRSRDDKVIVTVSRDLLGVNPYFRVHIRTLSEGGQCTTYCPQISTIKVDADKRCVSFSPSTAENSDSSHTLKIDASGRIEK